MPVPETDAGHAWHSLIDEKERQRFVAQLELFHELESGLSESPASRKFFPYCRRKSRSTARRTSTSSSTVRITGFFILSQTTTEAWLDQRPTWTPRLRLV